MAHPAKITVNAFFGSRSGRKFILAKRSSSPDNLILHFADEVVVDATWYTLAFPQVIDFHVVSAFAGQFLVPKCVNVELVLGYFPPRRPSWIRWLRTIMSPSQPSLKRLSACKTGPRSSLRLVGRALVGHRNRPKVCNTSL